jgi:hypothetical protein
VNNLIKGHVYLLDAEAEVIFPPFEKKGSVVINQEVACILIENEDETRLSIKKMHTTFIRGFGSLVMSTSAACSIR